MQTEQQEQKQQYEQIMNDNSVVVDGIELQIVETSEDHKIEPIIMNRHFGNNCVFVFIDDEPKYTLGPHWMVFICAFTFNIGIQIFFINSIGQIQGWLGFTFQSVLAFCQLISFLLTAIMNPGIKTSSQILTTKQVKSGLYCLSCRIERQSGYYHCYDCDVCIAGYDHHCPWTGKCIGQGNIKLFNRFIILTFINCGYYIFIALVKL